MRVYIEHRQKLRLFGADKLQVVVSVLFTELEQTVIDTYGLDSLIVIERKPTVYRDSDGKRRETDNNIYLRHFRKHAYVEQVVSPPHAAAFEEELRQALENVKAYLTRSTTPPQNKVYEL